MIPTSYILLGYSIFLLMILVINLLYFFQVFKYRLPGDASLVVTAIHLALIIVILLSSSLFLNA